MTSNLAESFNSWLLIERVRRVSLFVKEHVVGLGELLKKNMLDMESWNSECGSNISLEESRILSEGMQVITYNGNDFKVVTMNGEIKVNLVDQTCSCRKWQLFGIPCQHLCAVLRAQCKNVEFFLNEDYKREKQEQIYSMPLIPLETFDEPLVDPISYMHDSHDSSEFSLAPPLPKRAVGGLKK